MDNFSYLIDKLLQDDHLALVPHNPTPDKEHQELFDYFNNLDKNKLYQGVLDRHEYCSDENFNFAFNTIKYYKGDFVYFDNHINFKLYKKIKPWLTDDSIIKFKIRFFNEYGYDFLNNDVNEIDNVVLNLILINNIKLYMKIAKKLNIVGTGTIIYNQSPMLIFEWLNMSDNMYNELIKLNQPQFILENMNGRLDVSEGALKYIIEHSEPDISLFLSIKHTIGLQKLWEISNNKINPIFYINLIETLDDFIFIIRINGNNLKVIELSLETLKLNFPNVYANLNSLLPMTTLAEKPNYRHYTVN